MYIPTGKSVWIAILLEYLVVMVAAGCMGGNSSRLLKLRLDDLAHTAATDPGLGSLWDSSEGPNKVLFDDTPRELFLPPCSPPTLPSSGVFIPFPPLCPTTLLLPPFSPSPLLSTHVDLLSSASPFVFASLDVGCRLAGELPTLLSESIGVV